MIGPDTSWGSHFVPLMACVCETRGPILELGVGNWSTPFLHAYCAAAGRKLVSVDEDRQWVNKFANLRVCDHDLRAVVYDEFLVSDREIWSVVLMDHSPGWRRAADALILRQRANYLIVHDLSGDEVAESFPKIIDMWPHVATAQFSPTTLILGNREIPSFDKKAPFRGRSIGGGDHRLYGSARIPSRHEAREPR